MSSTIVAERPPEAPPPAPRIGAAPVAPARRFSWLIARHPVLVYYGLVFAISWGALLPVTGGPLPTSGAGPVANPLFVLGILTAPLAPTIASLALTGLLDGRAGYRELLGRLRRWRVGAGWYALALLTAPLSILLGALLLAVPLRSPEYLPSILTAPTPLGLVLVGATAGLVAGIFEEGGWTGFAVPRLRRQHGLLATAVPLGLLWGAWHFPLFWRADSFAGALPLALLLVQLFGWLPAYRVLLVAVHDRTASLPVVMLMHVSLSASRTILDTPGLSDAQSLANLLAWAALLWAAAGVAVLADRRQPLQRSLAVQQG